MIQKLIAGFFGILLLPAVAGLSMTLYQALIELQMDDSAADTLQFFLLGTGVQATIFLCFPKALRSYILAHELSHLFAAWLSGVPAGHLRVGKDGGSVEVEKSTFFIALAPYLIPFYSLLLLAVHSLAQLWWDPEIWASALPFGLGLTWSFHLSFTVYTLSITQSDVTPYGRLGAFSFILFGNLLILCLMLFWINEQPFTIDISELLSAQQKAYSLSWKNMQNLFSFIKNTIIQA